MRNRTLKIGTAASGNGRQAAGEAVLGYDPGGNDCHGVAVLWVRGGRILHWKSATVPDATAAATWLQASCKGRPRALGIDALLALHGGPSGLRPADRELAKAYPAVRGSVLSPNSLHGSMMLNGLVVAHLLRQRWPDLLITEVHPKVLRHALGRTRVPKRERDRYQAMKPILKKRARTPDERDALLCAYAAWRGFTGAWTRNLHVSLDLMFPAGRAFYYWPSPSRRLSRSAGAPGRSGSRRRPSRPRRAASSRGNAPGLPAATGRRPCGRGRGSGGDGRAAPRRG